MMDDRFEDERNDELTEDKKQERWDKIHSRTVDRDAIRGQYDGWLEQNSRIEELLKECKTPILDLGCGVGIDTLHLVESGHRVIASDFSPEALKKVEQNIPEARTLQFNMKEKFPFGNELFDFIVANKSIHYFSEEETRQIVEELYRVIKPNGVFAFVVNSINDSNFGAGQGRMIEDNYYEVRGTTKRFFDEESLKKFFDSEHWEFIYMNENEISDERIKTVQMDSKQAENKKVTWTCAVRRK